MTTVAILPVSAEGEGTTYHAVSGGRQCAGKTAGEALDALAAQLGQDETGTLVVVQHQRPDGFFTAEQQARLAQLMERWRHARDTGQALAADEQAELDGLVEQEVRGAEERAASVARELGK